MTIPFDLLNNNKKNTNHSITRAEDKYMNYTLPALHRELQILNKNLEKISTIDESLKPNINQHINNLLQARPADGKFLGSQFFQTRAGSKFFEHSLPELIKSINRLNDNLEELKEGESNDES